MVCLLDAPWVQLSVSVDNGWPHNALRHHWLMPISCHFRDCKALQVTSLTDVSSAIASVQTFTFIFTMSPSPFESRGTCPCPYTGTLPMGTRHNTHSLTAALDQLRVVVISATCDECEQIAQDCYVAAPRLSNVSSRSSFCCHIIMTPLVRININHVAFREIAYHPCDVTR